MSIRQFQPRGDRRRGISTRSSFVLYGLLLLAIACQISYPLVSGATLRVITFLTVYSAAGLMATHSWLSYGPKYTAIFLLTTFVFSLGVEMLGSRTGWPFGNYSYSQSLGIQILGVPVVVPFAWIMLSHPVLVAARKVSPQWVFLYGGVGLMAWDLFLDPQMVADGRWSWVIKGAHVPLESQIPLSNAFGWLFAGIVLMGLLNLILPKERRKRGANFTAINLFLLWTWFSGVVGNIFFFHRPGVALIGGIIFGLVFLPYLFKTWFGRPDDF